MLLMLRPPWNEKDYMSTYVGVGKGWREGGRESEVGGREV